MATRDRQRRYKAPTATATIINGMRPRTIGRAVGIGVRVAGRIAGQHIATQVGSGANTAQTQPAGAAAPAVAGTAAGFRAQNRSAQQGASRAKGGLRQGIGGFLHPFRRVGGIVWLEVTGLFFLIFVPVFAWRGAWPARASYAHGPDHMRFLVFIGLTLVFLYLGVSSFWRARRR